MYGVSSLCRPILPVHCRHVRYGVHVMHTRCSHFPFDRWCVMHASFSGLLYMAVTFMYSVSCVQYIGCNSWL